MSRMGATPVNSPFYNRGLGHYGAPVYHAGYVFVPIEPRRWRYSWLPRPWGPAFNAIGMFDASNLERVVLLPIPVGSPQREHGQLPWLAFNPLDGLFYSSNFDASEFFRYRIHLDNLHPDDLLNANTGPWIQFVDRVPLSDGVALRRVQGGVFSQAGRLYVSSDNIWTTALTVIEFDDWRSPREDPRPRPFRANNLGSSVGLPFSPSATGDEIQGLTIWDLDRDRRAPGIGGQLHIIMIDLDVASSDDLNFRHIRVNPAGWL